MGAVYRSIASTGLGALQRRPGRNPTRPRRGGRDSGPPPERLHDVEDSLRDLLG